MSEPLFELFLNPATMMDAELELLSRGEAAVPVLEALLNGSAKNRFGVPYRQLGLPLRCAIEVADRLGPIAKPLEPYLLQELKNGNHVAARALGSIGTLQDESICELAAALNGSMDLSFESAAAIIRCGQAQHPAVSKTKASHKPAAEVLATVESYLSGRQRR